MIQSAVNSYFHWWLLKERRFWVHLNTIELSANTSQRLKRSTLVTMAHTIEQDNSALYVVHSLCSIS